MNQRHAKHDALKQKNPVTVATLVATWFGCGYFPYGPGTAGSLAAVLIAAAAHYYFNAGRPAFLIATLLLLGPGIWSATQTARLLNREDPGMVVVDEVLGLWVTLLGAATLNWKSFLLPRSSYFASSIFGSLGRSAFWRICRKARVLLPMIWRLEPTLPLCCI